LYGVDAGSTDMQLGCFTSERRFLLPGVTCPCSDVLAGISQIFMDMGAVMLAWELSNQQLIEWVRQVRRRSLPTELCAPLLWTYSIRRASRVVMPWSILVNSTKIQRLLLKTLIKANDFGFRLPWAFGLLAVREFSLFLVSSLDESHSGHVRLLELLRYIPPWGAVERGVHLVEVVLVRAFIQRTFKISLDMLHLERSILSLLMLASLNFDVDDNS